MKNLPKDPRLIARARERFLESGDLGEAAVRDPILTSWRRSQFWGVSVELRELPRHAGNRHRRPAKPMPPSQYWTACKSCWPTWR